MQHRRRPRALPRPLLTTLLTALLAALLAAAAADATTVVRLSEEELIDGSQLVVVGTCRSTATLRRGGRLVTHAEVEVEQALKGRSRRYLTVVLPGGVDRHRVPPVAEVWAGAPALVAGERAVLFLRPAGEPGTWSVVGFDQGKLTLPATPGAGQPGLAGLAARVGRRSAAAAAVVEPEETP